MKHLTIDFTDNLSLEVQEALNRLRVNFLFCGTQYKKVMITSSLPDEGKSFVSQELAKLLAETGRKIAFIDCDLRKSYLSTEIKTNKEDGPYFGITEYLAGQADMADVVYSTNYPNLFIVPVFKTVVNPAILLQTDRLPVLLDTLAAECDYVIIDTPPLANVSDGGMIANYCEGSVLIVKAGSTSRNLISSSLKQLEQGPTQLLGVVLNNVKSNRTTYKNYGKYGYYK